jgi:ParB family chromosome partitioning protein
MSHQPNKKPATASGREALGKGIRSLLQNIDTDLKNSNLPLNERKVVAATGIERLPLDQIEINPHQPRHDFNEQALKELAQSIKLHDVIQPITVTRINNKKYRLISGERRLRAATEAGLKDIPAYIRQADDEALLELALLENLQREDLNAIEIALSMKRLMDECELTQEQLAARMGKERSTVTNYLRLLKLPPDIQVAVRNGALSMGHARALITVDTVDRQLYLFNQIIKNHLSVRQTEALVRKIITNDKQSLPQTKKTTLPPPYRKIEDSLASRFSTKVKLNLQKNGKGNIVIEFYSDEELNKILGLIAL